MIQAKTDRRVLRQSLICAGGDRFLLRRNTNSHLHNDETIGIYGHTNNCESLVCIEVATAIREVLIGMTDSS